MKYCNRCLQTDTRPNIKFDEKGICPACNYAESLKCVNWKQRRGELEEIAEFGRKNNYSGYDCIIGVSGGKDSTRQAIYVREELKLKPLLVSLNYPPAQLTYRGAHNISNMISLGFDVITIGPSPLIWKKFMRLGFFKYGNWAKSTELSLFGSVPRFAVAYQIPLIFWGENPALTMGELGVQSMGGEGNKMKNMNTLAGGDLIWLLESGVKNKQILNYRYPSDAEMERASLRIIYLGYYWPKWTNLDNGNFSASYGLDIRGESPYETGDLLGVTAVDDDWVILNQMIKYFKFGFGKVTEQVCEDVRYRGMDRQIAAKLIEKFDGKCSEENIETFCRFIDISKEEFWKVVDQFVNKDLFTKVGFGKWVPRFKVGENFNA